jgi:glutamyl-tRNA synthetase
MGGVRTALYNYLFAKKHNGTFILRIEDTDQERKVEGAEQYIIDALEWSGLECQEGVHVGGEFGPYRQSERKDMYGQFAQRLVDEGNAYYAFDTPEELEKMREDLKKQGVPSPQYNSVTRQYMKNSLALPADEVQARLDAGDPYVIRIKVPRKDEIKIEDHIRGWVSWQANQVDDKVLLKGDGMPTYHLANVVDDHHMEISHIIRGEEWLPSTPVHVLLYRFLGWEDTMPEFAHLPLILRPDGNGKLSKRDGDRLGFPVFPINWQDPESGEQSVGYKERGFFPAAFVNMLAFLGWNPGTEQEVFTIDELVEAFSLERVGKAGAKFDFEKARWFNQQHLKEMADADLAGMFEPIVKEQGVEASMDELTEICRLLKERVYFIPELWEAGNFFFSDDFEYDEKTVNKKWNPEIKPVFEAFVETIKAMDPFSTDVLEAAVHDIMEANDLKFGDILPVFRVMITGQPAGPPLYEVAVHLGQERVVSRMEKAISTF